MTRSRWAGACAALLLVAGCAATGTAPAPAPTLSARLQRLEDVEQIRALLNEYGRRLDQRDFAGFAALFAADGEWLGGFGQAQGQAAIRALMEASIPPRPAAAPDRRQHFFTNQSIRVDGDAATATSNWAFVIGGQSGAPQLAFTGHYEDALVREGGEWRFRRRRVLSDFPAAPPGG